jgi:hypothetical protein
VVEAVAAAVTAEVDTAEVETADARAAEETGAGDNLMNRFSMKGASQRPSLFLCGFGWPLLGSGRLVRNAERHSQ